MCDVDILYNELPQELEITLQRWEKIRRGKHAGMDKWIRPLKLSREKKLEGGKQAVKTKMKLKEGGNEWERMIGKQVPLATNEDFDKVTKDQGWIYEK